MRRVLYLLALLFIHIIGFAAEWQLDKDAKNLVKFTSEVVVLTFDGVTDDIDGYLYWEGETPFEKNTQLHFEVDLNTLSTDNGKRDRDMRDVLETGKWQFTTFDGIIANFEKIDSTVTAYKVTAKGKIFIHGVEKELEAPGMITQENEKLHVVCNFSVFLKDFKIAAPTLAAFVKVSEEIKLHLDFYLKETTQ
jgi:polyisoprenoid-binding protein YceI